MGTLGWEPSLPPRCFSQDEPWKVWKSKAFSLSLSLWMCKFSLNHACTSLCLPCRQPLSCSQWMPVYLHLVTHSFSWLGSHFQSLNVTLNAETAVWTSYLPYPGQDRTESQNGACGHILHVELLLASLTSLHCRCQPGTCARLRGHRTEAGLLFNCLPEFLPSCICLWGTWHFSYCESSKSGQLALCPLYMLQMCFPQTGHLYFNFVGGFLLYGTFNFYGVKFVNLFLNGFWIVLLRKASSTAKIMTIIIFTFF